MSDRFTIRPAKTSDLGTIADSLVAGLTTYRGWTPVGWNPPQRTEMLLGLLQRFPRDGSWAHVAFERQAPAGHISLRPDRDEDEQPRPEVALITHLFVREEYWGSGLAVQLHELGVADMRERGFRVRTAARGQRPPPGAGVLRARGLAGDGPRRDVGRARPRARRVRARAAGLTGPRLRLRGGGRRRAGGGAGGADRAGVSAEATITRMKARACRAMPSASLGSGSPKTMIPPAIVAMFAAVPVIAMTGTASPSCSERAEA